MITLALLWWVGIQLSAPWCYFLTLGLGMVIKFVDILHDMYKLGKENAEK